MIEVKAFYIYIFWSLDNNLLFKSKSRTRGLLKFQIFSIMLFIPFGPGNDFLHETRLSAEMHTNAVGWGFFPVYFVESRDVLLTTFIWRIKVNAFLDKWLFIILYWIQIHIYSFLINLMEWQFFQTCCFPQLLLAVMSTPEFSRTGWLEHLQTAV